MARRPPQPPPQPPWVWGPSEVNEWIRGSYPSGRRSSRAPRRQRSAVRELRVRCRAESDLRGLVIDAFSRAGFSIVRRAGESIVPRATGAAATIRIRGSLRRGTFVVSLRFDPSARPSDCRKALRLLRKRATIVGITYKAAT